MPEEGREAPGGGLSRGEAGRKLVHVGVGGLAFLLRFLTWRQAALMAAAGFVFNWQLFPRMGGKGLWRGEDHRAGYARGVLLYPASVLALILAFRDELWMAAAIWGVMAFGDGMASILGQALPGPRLPWNPRKGWVGLLAFVVFGTLGASVLIAWTLHLPLAAWSSWRILGLSLPLTLLCALVESMPTTLDDNLTVPLVGGVVLPLLASASLEALGERELAHLVAVGLAFNLVIAVLGYRAGSIDLPGAFSAIVIGTAITVGLGLAALSLMVGFFVIGSAATRAGYRTKAARGIAQEKGGARGWRNAWANGGVPAFLALLGGMSPPLRPLYALAYAASVATAAADTCSSEVGKAFGRRTFLVTTFRPVPAGTEGAVSLEGTLAGLLGGFLIAAAGAAGDLYSWSSVPIVALAALLGSLTESAVGTVAEKNGWMNNDLLNAFNTAAGAVLAVLLARLGAWGRLG